MHAHVWPCPVCEIGELHALRIPDSVIAAIVGVDVERVRALLRLERRRVLRLLAL